MTGVTLAKRMSMLSRGTATWLKLRKPLSDPIVAKLGTNVPHADAWQGKVAGHVADGHHECMRAVVSPLDEQPGHCHLHSSMLV